MFNIFSAVGWPISYFGNYDAHGFLRIQVGNTEEPLLNNEGQGYLL